MAVSVQSTGFSDVTLSTEFRSPVPTSNIYTAWKEANVQIGHYIYRVSRELRYILRDMIVHVILSKKCSIHICCILLCFARN